MARTCGEPSTKANPCSPKLRVGVGSGGDSLQTGRGVAGYVQRGGSHRDRFAIDRAPVTQLPGLLDDGACSEFGLRRYVERVRRLHHPEGVEDPAG